MFEQYQSAMVTSINTAIEVYIVILVFFGRLFPLKNRKYMGYIKHLLPFLVFFLRIAFYFVISSAFYNIILSFVIFIVILFLLYEGEALDKILSAVSVIVFTLITELLVSIVYKILNVNPLFMNDISYQLIYTVTTKTVMFWICLICANTVTKKYRNLPVKYWVIIITVPIASVIILYTVYWSIIYTMDKYRMFLVTTIIGLLYMNYSVFAFIDSYTTNVKLTVLESLIEKENENYKQLGVSYDQLRKIRHDFKNHIVIMKSFMKNKDVEMLGKYIDDFESNIYETSMIYTQNPAIDALINIKGVLAKENNINYVVKTSNIIENISLSPYNICRIIGNAIDNAVEACMRIEDNAIERFIFISLQRIDNNMIILVENSADRVKLSMHNQYESLKENKGFHGLGLNIISDAVKELGGYMNVTYSNNIFKLHVVLPENNIIRN